MLQGKPKIQTKQSAYIVEYDKYAEIADQQLSIFWPHTEVNVAKDKQSLLVDMTPPEYHGVVTVLKLFTTYELKVGVDYWLGRAMRMFPRPEIQRMCSAFGNMELNSHMPFYAKINEELGISTQEFYDSYVKDPTLKARMEFIDAAVVDKSDPYSLAVFSLIEGCVLYSSFAFLKSFQSQAKNKLMNVVRGVNFSVTDESLHSRGGAELCKDLINELEYTSTERTTFQNKVYEAARQVLAHEERIVDMIFEKGDIDGISKESLKFFVKSRVNVCLQQLDLDTLYTITENPIAEWFYDSVTNYQSNDFFSGVGREYERSWSESGFIWESK